MNGMSFLERLLDGVDVQWLELGAVAKYSDVRIDFDRVNKENYVGVDNLLQNRAGKGDSNYVPAEGRLIEYRTGDVLIGNIRPYLKKIWLANQAGGTNGDVLVIRPTHQSLSSGYLHQVLMDDNFFAYNTQFAKGAKMPRGDKAKILKYLVPIPCPQNPKKSLEIQAEIVGILDAFSQLTAELTAELTARKKQYNFYRDQLLNFEDRDVEWKTLEAITRSIASGRNKIRTNDGDIPVYGSTGLIGFTDEANYSGDVLLVARVGANAGRVNAVSGNFDVSDNTLIICPINDWNIRFAFHQLTHLNLNQYAVGGGQPLVTGGLLKSLQVPFPSLDEQERIAGILDKFETLINSLSDGLPREIELRQRQYAYYRDLLLDFPKPEEVET